MKTNHDIALELIRGDRGGFMRQLGELYCAADSGNQDRLETAFPHVFNAPKGRLEDLNPEQQARILAFAKEYGPMWKDELSQMWWTGRDANERDGHLLRQVRNHFGPSWLTDLTLPK